MSRTASTDTANVRAKYDDTAGTYDRRIRIPERLLFKDGREWVCAQASGRVLEIAMGTGRNLPYYPPDVEIAGVELSSEMAALARERARQLGRELDLRVGDAQSLEFPDESFDTVVCTLSLCTIPDDGAAVAEAWRVLRPGGRLVLLEHVRSPVRLVRAVQRALEPLFLRFQHDHLLREPLERLGVVGFDVEVMERYSLGIVERLVARKKPRAETREGG